MQQRGPWGLVSSRVAYENPWIRVREDQVIRPNGEPGIYGVVTAKKVAVGVVALTDDDCVHLVGQYRYPLDAYSWEIVEGGSEPGEELEQSARRELREEAGVIAARIEPLGHEVYLSNCFSDERAVFFLATGLTSTACEPEGTEVLQHKLLPADECIAMVKRGEITDAMSVVALMYLDQRRRR